MLKMVPVEQSVMSWPPIPKSGRPISVVRVPKHLCFQAPYSLAAPLPKKEHENLSRQTRLAKSPAVEIIARPGNDGEYEVLYGWTQFLIWVSLFGPESIPLKVAAYSDYEAVRLAVRETYEHEGNMVHRMWVARALLQAKQHFGFSDAKLSNAMGRGYSRSFITNLLRLNKLKKSVQDAYLQDRLKDSYAKALCSAPFERQDELLAQVLSRKLDLPALEAELGYEPPKKQSSTAAASRIKSPDEKRFERDMSEAIGAPVTIDGEKGEGELRAQFFNLHELGNIVEKLNPAGRPTPITGVVVVKFSGYGELGRLTDPILGGDDDY